MPRDRPPPVHLPLGHRGEDKDPYYTSFIDDADNDGAALGAHSLWSPQTASYWDGTADAVLVEIEGERQHYRALVEKGARPPEDCYLGTAHNGRLRLVSNGAQGDLTRNCYKVVDSQGNVIGHCKINTVFPEHDEILWERIARGDYGLYYANRSVLILCFNAQRRKSFQTSRPRRQYRCLGVSKSGMNVGLPCFSLCGETLRCRVHRPDRPGSQKTASKGAVSASPSITVAASNSNSISMPNIPSPLVSDDSSANSYEEAASEEEITTTVTLPMTKPVEGLMLVHKAEEQSFYLLDGDNEYQYSYEEEPVGIVLQRACEHFQRLAVKSTREKK